MAAELGKRLWRRTAHAIRKPVVPAREPSPEAMASETIPKVLIIHQPQRGKKKILKEENKDLMGLRDFHMIGKGCFCVQLPECRKMGARRREEGGKAREERGRKEAWGRGTRSRSGPLPSPGSHTSLTVHHGLSCFIAQVSESRAVCRRSRGARRPLAAVIYFRSEHRTAVPITEALEAW